MAIFINRQKGASKFITDGCQFFARCVPIDRDEKSTAGEKEHATDDRDPPNITAPCDQEAAEQDWAHLPRCDMPKQPQLRLDTLQFRARKVNKVLIRLRATVEPSHQQNNANLDRR